MRKGWQGGNFAQRDFPIKFKDLGITGNLSQICRSHEAAEIII
jgi:hypothetical protein